MLNEVRLGRPRLEALDDMGRRNKVEELNNFLQAIIQSEQLGVGIANVLRIQSEEIRRRRRQRAEEAGQKAPIKMLHPDDRLHLPDAVHRAARPGRHPGQQELPLTWARHAHPW